MKTWLLMAIDPADRLYQGHDGYIDELSLVYRYDSFVPNHRNLAIGDTVLLRDKTEVRGCAIIESLKETHGLKTRNRCPSCGATKIKERRRKSPIFRCECGAVFDSPQQENENCILYEARFGNSFQDLHGALSIRQLWSLAPRLNKQMAILELDASRVAILVAGLTDNMGRADEPTVAARAIFAEGERTTVLVNRYERDPRARKACLDHYGYRCFVCGFSYSERYGKIGEGVIEIHHLLPLGIKRSSQEVDPILDLRPLCANCHTIVHQQTPPLTIEELHVMLINEVT